METLVWRGLGTTLGTLLHLICLYLIKLAVNYMEAILEAILRSRTKSIGWKVYFGQCLSNNKKTYWKVFGKQGFQELFLSLCDIGSSKEFTPAQTINILSSRNLFERRRYNTFFQKFSFKMSKYKCNKSNYSLANKQVQI